MPLKISHLEKPVGTEVLGDEAVVYAVPHEAGEVDDGDREVHLHVLIQRLAQKELER